MRLLIALALAAALSGCAGVYVAGDLGAHSGDSARHLGPSRIESR